MMRGRRELPSRHAGRRAIPRVRAAATDRDNRTSCRPECRTAGCARRSAERETAKSWRRSTRTNSATFGIAPHHLDDSRATMISAKRPASTAISRAQKAQAEIARERAGHGVGLTSAPKRRCSRSMNGVSIAWPQYAPAARRSTPREIARRPTTMAPHQGDVLQNGGRGIGQRQNSAGETEQPQHRDADDDAR